MAGKKGENQEHAFQRIDKQIKGGTLKNPLIFCGREQYLIDWAVAAIEKKFINPSCRQLNISKPDPDLLTFTSLRDSCETLPLFSEKRVVVVSDFTALQGQEMRSFTKEDEAALEEYLKDLPESCILILINRQLNGQLKLCKAAAAAGEVFDFDALQEGQLRSFIVKRIKQAEKTASPSVINRLIELSGYHDKESDYTLYNLENDIRKAVAHADGGEIRAADVEETVSGNLNAYVFDLVDALSSNRKAVAFQKLHDLLVSGVSHYQLLALICSQFELVLKAKEMKAEGRTMKEMSSRLGAHEFRVKKALSFSGRYTESELHGILLAAYRVDKNIKEGLLDETLALEMLIAEI